MTPPAKLPLIIQGGMGLGVSTWRLARVVSLMGHLGVVTGTAIDVILARRLQDGDPGGHLRRGLEAFPIARAAERILDRYFISGGKDARAPYRPVRRPSAVPTLSQLDLIIAANFVEVFLAKDGHDGLVGVNLLEKIQPPNIPSLYGAMLAGVDVVLMGAGIPTAIPGLLDRLAQNLPCELRLALDDHKSAAEFAMRFDPVHYARSHHAQLPPPQRPEFYAIISTDALASTLLRRAGGRIDGFVIENATAGGHNANPRGGIHLNEQGEPIYGPRDRADCQTMQSFERPFWLAGSHFGPTALHDAISVGAAGIQVGTPFALCNESGIQTHLKDQILDAVRNGSVDVLTDPLASPAGFPFKIAQLDDTLSDDDAYRARQRRCDLGYFRRAYVDERGALRWRCPAEPTDLYIRKGGALQDTVGRQCLCNSLLATVGLGQQRPDSQCELPLVTAGQDIAQVVRFLKPGSNRYGAADVINQLLSDAGLLQPPHPHHSRAGGNPVPRPR